MCVSGLLLTCEMPTVFFYLVSATGAQNPSLWGRTLDLEMHTWYPMAPIVPQHKLCSLSILELPSKFFHHSFTFSQGGGLHWEHVSWVNHARADSSVVLTEVSELKWNRMPCLSALSWSLFFKLDQRGRKAHLLSRSHPLELRCSYYFGSLPLPTDKQVGAVGSNWLPFLAQKEPGTEC